MEQRRNEKEINSLNWIKIKIYITLWNVAKTGVSQVALVAKNLPANAGDVRDIQSLGWEDPLEKGMATHFSVLAWRILKTEKLGRVWPIGLRRVRHNWSDLAYTLKYPWSKQRFKMNFLSFYLNKQEQTKPTLKWKKKKYWKAEFNKILKTSKQWIKWAKPKDTSLKLIINNSKEPLAK